jgi:glycosyltransferase 2 family protein
MTADVVRGIPETPEITTAGVAPRRARRLRRLGPWLRWLLVVVVIVGLSRLVTKEDLDRAWAQIRHCGWPLVLVMVPTLVAMALDAIGWKAILRTLGHVVPLRRMVELRLSVEAIVLALPGGSVAGEAAKVGLLRQRAGVPISAGAASLALTKLMLVGTDALYLLVIGIWLLASPHIPSSTPALFAFGGVVFTGVLTLVMWLLLRRSSIAGKFARGMSRLPVRFLARWADDRRAHFEELDTSARAHFAAPARTRLACVVPFALEWVVEGVETLIILRCLGVPIGLGETLALDGLGSLLRAVVFFVPAGLGIQDAFQVMLLGSLGVVDPIATGTAFIVIKRAKEILWIAIGLLLLVGRKGPWRRPAVET